MKKVLMSFLAAFLSLSALAQSTQPCVVKQYNQKEQKTPLPGVEVMVSNAGSTVSDNAGELTLAFRTLKPGDKVNLVSAKKNGFELMNTDAVDQWNIAADQRPFELVMVNSAFFAQLKARLKQTSTESYKAKYEKAVKDAEALKRAAKISEEEYYRQLDELETQYMNSLKNIDTYIDQFARIDLSEVSAEEQRILEMVEEGRIDEAVEAWDKLDILNKLLQEKRAHKKLTEAEKAIREAKEEKKDNIDHLKVSLRNHIATLKLAGGKENYDKAGLMLKENALADTTDVDAVWEYAEFACNQHDFTESERFYLIALDIYSVLFDQAPDAYRADLGKTQNNLGNLYNHLHNYSKSEEYYLQALENYTILFNQNPERTYRAYLATIQNNMGCHYSDLHDYPKAEEYYLKALENWTILFNQNPNVYHADLASIQNNLGSLYNQLHDYAKSEDYFLKALENYTILFNQNPDAYRTYLATTQDNLGMLYILLNAFTKSEEYLLKALENRTLLFNQNPDAYRADLAMTQNILGMLYNYFLNDYTKSEEYYLKALENYTVLFNQNPDVYRADLAMTQYNLGYLYILLNAFAKSEAYFLKSLENYKVLFEESPDTYRPGLALVQYLLVSIYSEDGHPASQYDAMLEAALANYEVLFKEDNNNQPIIVDLRLRKGSRALEAGDEQGALDMWRKVLELDPEFLSKQNGSTPLYEQLKKLGRIE